MARIFDINRLGENTVSYCVDQTVWMIVCGPEDLELNGSKIDEYSLTLKTALEAGAIIYITPYIASNYMKLLTERFTTNGSYQDSPERRMNGEELLRFSETVIPYYEVIHELAAAEAIPSRAEVLELTRREYNKGHLTYDDLITLYMCATKSLVLITDNPDHRVFSGEVITYHSDFKFT